MGLSVDGILEKNKLEGSPWAFLFTFYLTPIILLHYTNYDQDISFGGEIYYRLPMNLSTMTKSRDGQLQDFTIQLSNVDGIIQALLFQYDGFRKCRVVIQVVNVENADAYTDPENYRVDKTSFSAEVAEITLGMTENVLQIKLPKRIFFKNDFPFLTSPGKK